ncbi:MAG TPA: VIT domain-containing protein [Kofleriaceae bacterium]|nr:VIT domain-containing protein [Kofleriaceae bacterium]
MVRPAWLVALAVAIAAPARASSVLPGRMGMYTQQGAALAMTDSKIVVRVRGPIAEAVVTQTFKNDLDRVTEATYIFPLPVDAAVSAMEIESGARTIHAAIEVREQAQQRYETAVAAGVGAALLDQERPDVFTQTVSAIPAKGTVVVTLRFDTVARYHGGHWELVLPMVVAPRYVPGSANGLPTTGTGRAPDTDRAPDASRVTPGGAPGAGGKTDVVLELGNDVDDVSSPTHDLVKEKAGYALHDAKSDHDAVIRWRAKVPAAGWVEASDDGGFAAVVVEARAPAAKKSPLRMMLVLERAATTRGDADNVKHPLVRALLGALDSKDQVSLAGSDKLDWRAPDAVLRVLEDSWHKAGGPFDLTKTLQQLRSNGAPLVLVTDGLVADDRAVLVAAAKVGAPIHVIGIGPAPNRGLLTQLAATTGGTVRFATIGDDTSAIAKDVLADAASQPEPLSITWGTLAASDVVPATLPRLGAGQAMLVVAKVKKVQTANARVRGDLFGFTMVTVPKPPDGATTPKGSLARRWAKLKLDDLVAGGNAKTITEHALHYGLVSPYTSMVAIGDEVVVKGGVKHSVPVTVSVPEGMRWQLVKREITIDTRIDTTVTKQEQTKLAEDKKKPKDKLPAKKEPGRDEHAQKPRDTKPRTERPQPVAVPEATAVPTQPTIDHAGAEGAGATNEDDGDYEGRKSKRDADEEAPRAEPAPPSPGSVATADYDADGEMESLSISSSRYKQRRLTLSLGGGVSVVNGDAAPQLGLALRLDWGRETRIGGEASVWLVDGLHGQGNVLATVAQRIARRLELGIGGGLRFTGDVAGPALNLTLRSHLPIRGLSTFLRYDGALLIHDGTYDGQNGGSFGFEASF